MEKAYNAGSFLKKGGCVICGIAGYIGESKKPDITYAIITSLFAQTESRGRDAAGFWGTQKDDGKILYHKEPIPSSEFVKKDIWKKISKMDPNILLVHSRGASAGVGTPSVNANNHPFVSTDKKIGLIHNGRIPDLEYNMLKKKYEVSSTCDSEIFLRIFEAADDSEYASGLSKIWSQVLRGHMAIAIGERLDEGHRRLWLSRNKYRTLWLIDLREQLGQIFFCSTPDIWTFAANECAAIQPFIKKKVKLAELPTEEVWSLTISPEQPVVKTNMIRKFEVEPDGYEEWEHDGDPLPIIQRKTTTGIFTKLDDRENVICSGNKNGNGKIVDNHKSKSRKRHENNWPRQNVNGNLALFPDEQHEEIYEYIEDATGKQGVRKLNEHVSNIRQIAQDIETLAENLCVEGSVEERDMVDLLTFLETTENDLAGTLKILEH